MLKIKPLELNTDFDDQFLKFVKKQGYKGWSSGRVNVDPIARSVNRGIGRAPLATSIRSNRMGRGQGGGVGGGGI